MRGPAGAGSLDVLLRGDAGARVAAVARARHAAERANLHLTLDQRANAMQAIIAWGERNLAERDRVGYVEKKQKSGDQCESPTETPLSWKD